MARYGKDEYKDAIDAGSTQSEATQVGEEATLQKLQERAAKRPNKRRLEKLATYQAYLDQKRASEATTDPAAIEQRKRIAMQDAGAVAGQMGSQLAGTMLGAEGAQYQAAELGRNIGGQVAEAGAQAGLTADELQQQIAMQRAQAGQNFIAQRKDAQAAINQGYFGSATEMAGRAGSSYIESKYGT